LGSPSNIRNIFSPRKRITSKAHLGKSRTHKEFAEECDINKLLLRYPKTGVLPLNKATPKYGDFTNVPDYQNALNVVRTATTAFEALPAPVRKRFNNDAQAFMEFATDKRNLPDMVKMGLATPPPVKEEAPKPVKREKTPSKEADPQ